MTDTLPSTIPTTRRRWPTYPAYKASGVDWLGEIPAHWEAQRLKKVAKLKYGGSLAAELREEGNIPVFGSNGVVGTHSQANTSTPALVIGRKGSYGKVNYSNGVCFAIDTTYFIDESSTKSSLKWLFYLLPLLGLDTASQDSAIPGLSREFAYEHWLPVPSLCEQRAIAAFLDHETAKIDELVAKKERLIQLLQEKRTALISHAVTKGIDPAALMKDSGVEWLGQIPAHWEIRKLKALAEVRTGVAKGRDLSAREMIEVPYMRVANVQDGYLDLSDVATISIGVDELENYKLKIGDVLMNEGGDNDKLGRGGVWQGQIEPCVHQNHVFAVRPHPKIESVWLTTITQTQYAKFYFMLKAKQSTNLASISSTNLKELPVVIPPKTEREAILKFIERETATIDALVGKVQEGIEKLKEYRTAVISAAVTGKIDVQTTVINKLEQP
jgi:type I restriction enzyme S subunit